MPTRRAEGLLVLTKASARKRALPMAAFRLRTPVPIPRQSPGGFPQLPAVSKCGSPRDTAVMGVCRQGQGTWGTRTRRAPSRRCRHRATVAPAAPGCGRGGVRHWQPRRGAAGFGRVTLMLTGDVKLFASQSRGVREIPALKRSLEERHQHLSGKQMESGERSEAATGSQA